MFRLVSLLTVAVCFQFLVITAVPFAQNQQPQQGGPQGPGAFMDRMMDRLNRELNLTADQQKKIKAIYEQSFKNATPSNDKGATGAAARRQRMAQQNNAQDDFRKRIEQTNAEIKKVLTPEQQKKFDAMPRGGGRGMGNVDERINRLDERLKLTAAQKTKLKAVFEKQNQAMQKRMEQMRQQGDNQQQGGDRQAMMDEMRKEREKGQKEVEAVLTPEQQKQYRAMMEEQQKQWQQRQEQRGGGNNQ